jgi:hypothetical protein
VGIAVPVARLLTSLVISGVALLATGLVLSVTPARATVRTPLPEYDTSEFRYTDKSAAAATVGRTMDIYIVEDQFDAAERERIGLALQQWNHALNGYVRFRPVAAGRFFGREPDPALSVRRLDRDQGRPLP